MKLFNKIMAVGVMAGPAAFAQAVEIQIDKGTVNLDYSPAQASYELNYQVPENCPGTTVVREVRGNRIILSHTGDECPKGATFTLNLSNKQDVSVALNAGVVRAKNGSDIARQFESTELEVQAGMIRSQSIPTLRTNYFAGAKGSASSTDGSGHLKINVMAGTVEF